MQIVGIAGSIRAGSYNRALLAAAVELAPEGLEIVVWDRLREVPLYDGDADNDASRPEPVSDLKARILAADGLLLASPEYNYSVPGVLKNAIDWVSRPGGRSVLVGKPVGIVGASSGAIGTARGQAHLREVMYSTMARVFPHGGVTVATAAQRFAAGRLTDEATRRFLAAYLAQLAEFIRTGTVPAPAPPAA